MSNHQRLATAPGLTPTNTCIRLAELAQHVPAEQAIVEIGVYKGRTTCWLAHGARHGHGAHVYGIDPWDLPGDRAPYGHIDGNGNRVKRTRSIDFTSPATRVAAERTVRTQGMRKYVTLIRGFSTEVAAGWEHGPVGLLYVDGDHTYNGARGDVEAWLPHLADGALVVFDDHNDAHPEVVDAVNDLVREGVLELVEVAEDRLAVTQYLPRRGVDLEERVAEPGESLPELDEAAYGPEAEPLSEPISVPAAETAVERPPTSGKGSGVGAWRTYAAQVTDTPEIAWAILSRTEIIELLESEGYSD